MAAFVGRVFSREPGGAIGDPVAGAEISFRGPSGRTHVQTAGNGSYRAELPTGTYQAILHADGFRPERTRAILRQDSQTLNFFIESEAAATPTGIHGRIFERQADGTIGDPVPAASVGVGRTAFASTTRSDPEGRFSLELPPGRYLLDARSEGFRPTRTRVVVREGFSVINLFLRAQGIDVIDDAPPECQAVSDEDGVGRTSEVLIPGGDIVEMTYRVVDGKAWFEGGICLGNASELDDEVERARRTPADDDDIPNTGSLGTVRQALVALGSRDKLWEQGLVPFQIDESNATLRDRIAEAMGHIEDNTNVVFLPASNSFRDRVVIRFSRDPNASSADLGRKGGVQSVVLNEGFSVGGIVHELLHTLGVFHEQTRNDRDTFVTINTANIQSGRGGNFRKAVFRGGVDIGPYDFSSVMHYRANAFGIDDPANPGTPLITIQPVDPTIPLSALGSARNNPPYLSAGDISGLKELYPARIEFDGGHLWGAGNYTTGIAMGDIDGDGRDELVVARKAGGNGRYFILNDAARDFRTLITGGTGWGGGNYATCCAIGDVDGDGIGEVIIGRKAGANHRFRVIKIQASPWRETELFTGGENWGDGNYVTDVAIGVDASGNSLIGVARKAGGNSRFMIYAGSAGAFRLLFRGGIQWGDSNYATGIAFGDIDGDGRLEVGVTRKAGGNARWMVYKDVAGDYTDFRVVHSGGVDWGGGNYGTGIAFGDVDGDGRDEIAVARKAGANGRYFVFDDMNQQFRLLKSGGEQWGSGTYATSVALGDVDGDGRAELAVTRKSGVNARVFLFDDEQNNYRPLWDNGRRWGDGNFATTVALGNGFGPGRKRHVAVGRKSGSNHRFSVTDFNP